MHTLGSADPLRASTEHLIHVIKLAIRVSDFVCLHSQFQDVLKASDEDNAFDYGDILNPEAYSKQGDLIVGGA